METPYPREIGHNWRLDNDAIIPLYTLLAECGRRDIITYLTKSKGKEELLQERWGVPEVTRSTSNQFNLLISWCEIFRSCARNGMSTIKIFKLMAMVEVKKTKVLYRYFWKLFYFIVLGCIVAFTKVLTIYQIYHSWIHPLHHSLSLPPPIPRIVSTVSFFHLRTWVHNISAILTLPHLSHLLPLLLVSTPR
jgi:hypothetical protein